MAEYLRLYSCLFQTTVQQQQPGVPEVSTLPKQQKNINVRAAIIHVIGDLIQSIGVLIAAYVIKYRVLLNSI